MKKFMAEFKKFAFKGNVLDMAVGVVVGGAFNAIVTSLVSNIITPLIASLGGVNYEEMMWLVNGSEIKYGLFLNAIINFLITAFTLFVVIKVVNKLSNLRKKEEEAPAPEVPAEPTEKVCPYCCSTISIKATRCPHCTSVLAE